MTDITLMQRLLRHQWFLGIISITEIILGFILLTIPYILGVSVIILGGIALLIMGVLRLISLIRCRCDLIWNALCALAYLSIGAVMLLSPLDLLEIVTLTVAGILVCMGAIRLLLAIVSRQQSYLVWRLLNALVSFTLGILVCATWPSSSQWFIGVMVAIEMIFSGWTLLFLSITPSEVESIDEALG